jgi:uncharacterized protein YprB with RNaseH-like and TPR domain
MGLSEEDMRRLEALNGGPLRYTQRMASPAPAAPVRQQMPRRVCVSLEEVVAGIEAYAASWGCAYRIESPVQELGDAWADVDATFRAALAREDTRLAAKLAQLKVAGLRPEDVLFLDLETTGLSYTPLFLIGMLMWEAEGPVVRQYLARNYAEEAAVTALFLDAAAEKRLLISFNGKSFDVPYVRARAAHYGLPCALDHPHLDLLHESRRVWRGRVPNCRLQTLEQHICGHAERVGDIPSAMIPAVYDTFVRTGDARRLVQVLRHNVIDLITVAELMAKLP